MIYYFRVFTGESVKRFIGMNFYELFKRAVSMARENSEQIKVYYYNFGDFYMPGEFNKNRLPYLYNPSGMFILNNAGKIIYKNFNIYD